MSPFDNLLVLCCCYQTPGMQTIQMLLDLRDKGATVKVLRGPADVSLARCITADVAQKTIDESPWLEYVLLLDSDVWSSVDAVAKLINIQRDLSQQLDKTVSVSGLYLNRHKRMKMAAAHKLKGTDPIACGVPSLPGYPQPVAIAALTGLGAFLMTAQAMVLHCEESERMCWPDKEHTIPIVCKSGALDAHTLSVFIDGINPSSDLLFWQGEDFDFCVHELTNGRPVFAAPVLFKHTSTIELDPVGDVTFPGLFEPEVPQ